MREPALTMPVIRTPMWRVLVGLCALLLLAQLLVGSVYVLGDKGAATAALGSGQRLWLSPYADPLVAASNEAAPTENIVTPEAEPVAPDAAVVAPVAPVIVSAAPDMSEFAASDAEVSAAQAADAALPAAQEPLSGESSAQDSFTASKQEVLDAIPAEPRTAASLAAPLDSLLETSENGALPLRDGEVTAFDTYRKPFTMPTPAKPVIALIVSDLGALRTQAERATQLPANVTLAFNPAARHSASWLQTARNKGIESWLMLPVQPDSFPASDAGSYALLVDQPAEESLQKLKHSLAAAQGYTGLILPAQEGYSDHLESMNWLNQQLESRGLAVIASERPSNSAAAGWFKRQPRAYAGDVLIDAALSQEAMSKQLAALETMATQQGYALGVIRPYPLSLSVITPWLESLQQRGFVLAPASALLELSAK